MYNRSSGILLPISSLPSKYGIGTFGRQAYEFINFLQKSGQKFWQILPIGPISYGDSPYQSFSIYAGNPYYIDLELLIDDNLINEQDCNNTDLDDDKGSIDYEKQFNNRFILLRKAYDNSNGRYDQEIDTFKNENINWILDYGLYMALKYKNSNRSWLEWEASIKKREKKTIERMEIELKCEIQFWIFLQYIFFKQFFKLKEYANLKGVSIIGDIPIYTAEDSVDVWCNSKIFMLDENKTPILVSGVPPDAFSSDGQLWGNPVYDWHFLKGSSYEWWINRIKYSFKMYDVVRIDHFRGFDEFWAVKYGLSNAKEGTWVVANGREMFDTMKSKIGEVKIIAEDLGIITESVKELKVYTGFPGMKVLQFAFDGNPDNPYLPKNYEENCIAYPGTHDNDTLKGWFEKLSHNKQKEVLESLSIKQTDNINYNIIRVLYDSKASICIIPLQDFLCIGSEGRINIPSTIGDNWSWRVNNKYLTDELAEKIRGMVNSSKRV